MYLTISRSSLIIVSLIATAMLSPVSLGSRAQKIDPAATQESVAAQFVKIAEIDVIYATSFVKGFRDQALANGAPEKEVDCIGAKITPEFMRPLLADIMATHCSNDELRQAISFFESEIGKTYLQYERMRVKVMLGTSTEQPPAYSAREEERIVAFEATRVGKLIVSTDSPIRSAMKEKITSKFAGIYEQCKSANTQRPN